jgi:hypothetical protein
VFLVLILNGVYDNKLNEAETVWELSAGVRRNFSPERMAGPGAFNPPAAFPNRALLLFHAAKRFSLTRPVSRINSRRLQATLGKVIHKFTEFTRPAHNRHRRDT